MLPLDVSSPERNDAVVAVLQAVPLPVILLASDGTCLYTNSAWTVQVEELGLPWPKGTVGVDYFRLWAESSNPGAHELVRQLRELGRGERAKVRFADEVPTPAGLLSYHVDAAPVDGGARMLLTFVNVSAREHERREKEWLAGHDTLTGLPNRSHLHKVLDAELARAGRGPLSVLVLDVDGFTDVNDASGLAAGDDLLRQVATRLRRVARGSDVVGRLGDDEFLLVSPECSAEGAELLAVRCQAALATDPFPIAGRMVRLGASVGVATAPVTTGVRRAADLVRDADLALAAARSSGRSSLRSFDPELRRAAERRAALAAELESAIDADQLVLHYQPVLHLPSGRFSGVEALVRWQHPDRGLLAPGEFLPLVEQQDLLLPLTRWVLRTAAAQTAAWARQGLILTTGVNVHAHHLSTGTLVPDVLAALGGSGLPPAQFVVELTETSVAEDPECAAVQLAELRRRGVEVAIDDFGSGFSSLGQLVNLPAGLLKIDRSLVAFPEGRRGHAAAAIAAVVALGRACGMQSLAEGVETAEQLALATELGCTLAQGFHLARPMPADEVSGWMAARGGGRPSALPIGSARSAAR